jgi:ribose transport system substrate-binding protein
MVVYSVSGDAVVPGVKEAIAKGIKVVADFVAIGPTINAVKPQVKGLSGSVIVPIDETGTASGDLVVKACRGVNPCHVEYLTGTEKLPLTVDRTDHLMAVVKTHSNIQIVGTITGGYTSSKGYAAGEDTLSAHPTVNVIASPADQAIVGVAEAVGKAGDLKKIKLIGGGGTYQAIAGIKSGDWYGTVNYCPTSEAERATQIDIDAVLGVKVATPYVNSLTLCGAPVELTKTNVGSYKGEWTAG